MKTWFITGAARGFGGRVAERALTRGDQVVATDRDTAAMRERLGEHPRLLALALDVARGEQVQPTVAEAIARFGRIDVLLNSAGYGLLGAIEEATAMEVEAIYRTNVFGLLDVTRAVLPHMRARRAGRILNISSVGGYRGAAGWGVYCSTKFAVEGLSEALHQELAPLGIHVTVIEPAAFRTDFLDPSSLAVSAELIADYAATVGTARRRAVALNHRQPGDPDRLAEILIALAELEDPPLRLPLGSDAVAAVEAKHAADSAILERWRAVAVSADFDRSPRATPEATR
jgi:NAD(P)-dependent dehydrogenase (short-subunit alcohol dehydrogenase family)